MELVTQTISNVKCSLEPWGANRGRLLERSRRETQKAIFVSRGARLPVQVRLSDTGGHCQAAWEVQRCPWEWALRRTAPSSSPHLSLQSHPPPLSAPAWLWQGEEGGAGGKGHERSWGFLDLEWEAVYPALRQAPRCTCLVMERPKYPFLKSFLLAATTKEQGLTNGLDQFPPVEPLRKHTPNHRNEEISGPLGPRPLDMEPGSSLLLKPLICVQSIYHSWKELVIFTVY